MNRESPVNIPNELFCGSEIYNAIWWVLDIVATVFCNDGLELIFHDNDEIKIPPNKK